MKLESKEPKLDAAISYFRNMARGKTVPSQQNGQNGLGIARQASTYHVIPQIRMVTPTAQAVESAKASVKRQKVIRGTSLKKKKNTDTYFMPGLD